MTVREILSTRLKGETRKVTVQVKETSVLCGEQLPLCFSVSVLAAGLHFSNVVRVIRDFFEAPSYTSFIR